MLSFLAWTIMAEVSTEEQLHPYSGAERRQERRGCPAGPDIGLGEVCMVHKRWWPCRNQRTDDKILQVSGNELVNGKTRIEDDLRPPRMSGTSVC
jgi:hypothetical protein